MDIPMINEINENTNAAKNEILEAMPAAGATSAEVEAAKNAIIGAMPSGGGLTSCIRKIQRGTFAVNATTNGGSTSVTLSGFSDVNKMSVRLEGSSFKTGSNSSPAILPYVSALTASKLTVKNQTDGNGSNQTGSYEVIEFY